MRFKSSIKFCPLVFFPFGQFMTTVINALTLFKLIFAHFQLKISSPSSVAAASANNGNSSCNPFLNQKSLQMSATSAKKHSFSYSFPHDPCSFIHRLEKSSATSFAVHFAPFLVVVFFSSFRNFASTFAIKSNDPWCWCLSATNNVSSISSFAASSASSAESRDLSLLVVVFDDDVGGGGCGSAASTTVMFRRRLLPLFWSHFFSFERERPFVIFETLKLQHLKPSSFSFCFLFLGGPFFFFSLSR